MDRIDYETNRCLEYFGRSKTDSIFVKTEDIYAGLNTVASKLESIRSNYAKSILYDVNRFDVYDSKIEYSDSTAVPGYSFDVTSIAVGASVAVLFDFHLTGQTSDTTTVFLISSGGTFMFDSSCSTAHNSHYVGTAVNSMSALTFGPRTSDNHYIAKLVITRLT